MAANSRDAAAIRDTAIGEGQTLGADFQENGLHLDDPDRPVDDSDVDEVHLRRYGTLEEHIDAFIEAFNAHDVDYVVETVSDDLEAPGLGEDRAGFEHAIQDVWERRPNALLTRGLLGDEPVAVVWDVGERGAWDRIALLAFDAVDGDGEIGLVEVSESPAEIETADTGTPEDEHPEGTTWEEWYEGDGH